MIFIFKIKDTKSPQVFSKKFLGICLTKYKSTPKKILNVVQQSYMNPNFKLNNLYILSDKPDKYGEYIEEMINPEHIKFLDVIDVNKKGFSLMIEMGTLERFIVVFENPFDLNKIIKIVNKAKKNKEEIKKSKLEEIRFNIDYFENLLRTEVQKDFIIQVFSFLIFIS